MLKQKTCPECGGSIPLDAPAGFCPRCELAGALAPPPLDDSGDGNASAASGPGLGRIRYFGDYELMEEIARGGMGVVFKARQLSLNRLVAVKMILSAHLAKAEHVQRFRAEAGAAASLQHPNIVAIHEVGEHEGQHYFSMDFVDGPDLAELVRENPLSPPRAARYAKSIAEAIQHAHEHCTLHRDLKPSNVLIDESDQPRLTDFGLAKRLQSDSDLTMPGQMIGTPSFMPPEQAGRQHGEIGPHSDVYGIGAILYYVLTGRPPFSADSTEATLAQVLQTDAAPPRMLNADVPRDLETICLKCLEKDAGRRYRSARELADDLDRFLRGEPILARPVSLSDRVWRWCRRNPPLAGALGAILLLLVTVAVGSTVAAFHIAEARNAAQFERKQAQAFAEAEGRQRQRTEAAYLKAADTLIQLEIQKAEALFQADDSATALAHLAAVLRRDPSNRVAAERIMSALSQRTFALPIGPPLSHERTALAAHFSPDGRRVVTASHDHTARVWDAFTGAPLTDSLGHRERVNSARFSPDGKLVVTASNDDAARIFDIFTEERLIKMIHPDDVLDAEFSPDGRRVATACQDGSVRFWNAQDGQPLGGPLWHSGPVKMVRFSPDGRRLASVSGNTARLWDARSAVAVGTPIEFGSDIHSVQFSPDGLMLMLADESGTVRFCSGQNGQALLPPLHADGRCAVHLSPDASHIVAASHRNARIWDIVDRYAESEPFKHSATLRSARFSPDGLRVATTAIDRTARVWDVLSREPLTEPLRHEDWVGPGEFSPDGQRLLTAGDGTSARLWDIRPGASILTDLFADCGAMEFARFSPDDEQVITASSGTHAYLWNSRTGTTLLPPLSHNDRVRYASFSPDGKWVVTASEDWTACVWNARTGEPRMKPLHHDGPVNRAAFSFDGKWIVTASADKTVRVWDAATGQPRCKPMEHPHQVGHAVFSRDGKRVVTAATDTIARIWDSESGTLALEITEHTARVNDAQFSPDGTQLATASDDQTARVWDANSGKALTPPLIHSHTVGCAIFSPDGELIATTSPDYTARVWNARTGQPVTGPLQHAESVNTARFSPDGLRLVTSSYDDTARVWDAQTGHPLTETLRHGWWVMQAEFSPDSRRIVTVQKHTRPQLWEIPCAVPPAPDWLPVLAEAVGGRRLGKDGAFETVPSYELLRLKDRLVSSSADDDFTRWARWFFADRSTRTISLSSGVTVPEYVRRLVERDSVWDLQPAVALAPTNAVALARLARRFLEWETERSPRPIRRADFLSRRAVALAPNDREVLQIREEIAAAMAKMRSP